MKPVVAGAIVAVLAVGGVVMIRQGGPEVPAMAPAPATKASLRTGVVKPAGAAAASAPKAASTAPDAAADKTVSWKASELSQDEIKTRIAKADISETDRLALMGAFKHAAGDPAALQSVLDKLRLAIAAAKKK